MTDMNQLPGSSTSSADRPVSRPQRWFDNPMVVWPALALVIAITVSVLLGYTEVLMILGLLVATGASVVLELRRQRVAAQRYAALVRMIQERLPNQVAYGLEHALTGEAYKSDKASGFRELIKMMAGSTDLRNMITDVVRVEMQAGKTVNPAPTSRTPGSGTRFPERPARRQPAQSAAPAAEEVRNPYREKKEN